MLDVAFVTVLFKPNWSVTKRIVDAHGPALKHAGLSGCTFLVDNSPTEMPEAEAWAMGDSSRVYLWQGGKNTFVAGAINLVAGICDSRFMVYLCANHGLAVHPRWLGELLAPLSAHGVGASGSLRPCRYSCVPTRRATGRHENIHIQGGIWAARTETVRQIPSSDHFPQCYNDVEWSMTLLQNGLKLIDVPSIASVASGTVSQLPHHSYIHDYRPQIPPG